MPETIGNKPEAKASKFEETIPTLLSAIEGAQEDLLQKILAKGWSAEEVDYFLSFAVQEAIVNAMGHGNWDIPGGTPHIRNVIEDLEKNGVNNKRVHIEIGRA